MSPWLKDDELPFVGTDTSLAAAAAAEPGAATVRGLVLYYIRRDAEVGATDDEIEEELGMRHQTVSARRRELVLQGFIKDSGERRQTRSGRKAIVWVAVPKRAD
jgi:hypothetical protein